MNPLYLVVFLIITVISFLLIRNGARKIQAVFKHLATGENVLTQGIQLVAYGICSYVFGVGLLIIGFLQK